MDEKFGRQKLVNKCVDDKIKRLSVKDSLFKFIRGGGERKGILLTKDQ
jgi:hypothetical protein